MLMDINLDEAPRLVPIYQRTFLALQVTGGQVCLPLLLLTYLFLGSKTLPTGREIRRDPIVTSFVITWIISSICYSLMLYSTHSDQFFMVIFNRPAFCLVQACLTPAAQAMTTTSTLIVVINIRNAIIRSGFEKEKGKRDKLITLLFICIPYIVFLAFFVGFYLFGDQVSSVLNFGRPGDPYLFPTIFYCTLMKNSITIRASPISNYEIAFSIAITSCTLIIEGYLIWMIQARRRESITNHSVYRNILIRISVFSLYRICALVMLFVALLQPTYLFFIFSTRLRLAAELVQAAGPLVAFLILSTRSDVLRAWRLKKQQSSIQAMHDVDRERISRKTLRTSSLESERLEGNHSNKIQIAGESPHVSSEQEQAPYNPSFTPAKPATYSGNIKRPLPAIPRSERR